jgi:hypothetical protein
MSGVTAALGVMGKLDLFFTPQAKDHQNQSSVVLFIFP